MALLAACSSRGDTVPAPSAPPPPPAIAGESNIAARDYIGPAACGECHPEQHAQWSASLHRVMNQRVGDGDPIIAPRDAALHYRGGEVRLTRDAAGATMTFARGATTVRYRITRTIGHRGLQEYVGLVDGGDGEEVRLPVGWWPRGDGLYPQAYFDPWLAEDDVDIFAPVREPWAERCPWCHSTYPFEQRIARASGPRSVGHGLEQWFVAAPTGARLDVARQVTPGISCESCHLGGRAHADGGPIHFVPVGAEPKPGAPVASGFGSERTDATIVNGVCAQCHSGPSPRLPDGSATRNSSEALDLGASACSGARCTDCHDPHRGGADDARAIAACITCHPAFGDAAAARAHAQHDATVTCLDCHMPRVTMGIDRYVRSHRISSPANKDMLAAAAPNACNLCHLDRTIAWTLAELRTRFDVRIDLGGDVDSYGEPDAAVGGVWLASVESDVRVMAAMAYARSPLGRYALRDLAPLLDDDRPYVRTWVQFAIEQIRGRTLPGYDPRAPREQRRAAIQKLQR